MSSDPILTVAQLTEPQLRAAERLRELSQLPGVLVGALQGGVAGNRALWDVRPLLLEGRKTVIVRATAPELKFRARQFEQVREVLSRSTAISSSTRFGEAAGQLWVVRPYHPRLLSQVQPSSGELVPPLLRQVVAVVVEFAESGVCHGHLCSANIALAEDGRVAVVDAGFAYGAQEDGDLLSEAVMSAQLCGVIADKFAPVLTDLQRETVERGAKGTVSLHEISRAFAAPVTAGGSPTNAGRVLSGVRAARAAPPQAIQTIPSSSATPTTEPSAASQSPQSPPESAQPVSGANSENGGFGPAMRALGSRLTGVPGSSTRFSLALGAVVVFAVGYLVFPRAPHIPEFPAAEYWSSGRKGLMQQVAQDAIDYPDSPTRIIIRDAAASGEPAEGLFRSRILRAAFYPEWSSELSEDDQTAAFAFALSPLVPEALDDVDDLEDLHPAIQLAIIGDLDAQQEISTLGKSSAEGLSKLPGEIGVVFSRLLQQLPPEGQGPEDVLLSDLSVRLLARVIVDRFSAESLQAAFSAPKAEAIARALVPMYAVDQKIPIRGLQVLGGLSGVLSSRLGWFGQDTTVQWSSAPPATLLSIVSGEPPLASLNTEQLADLLSFPDSSVRSAAAVALAGKQLAGVNGLVPAVIAQSGGKLSRFQVVALLSGLELAGEPGYVLISNWFKTAPDPAAVLALLLARNTATGVDHFNVEASRYLQSAELPISDENLGALLQHPETLARAWAVTQLNPQRKEHQALAREALDTEKDARLIEQLKAAVEEKR